MTELQKCYASGQEDKGNFSYNLPKWRFYSFKPIIKSMSHRDIFEATSRCKFAHISIVCSWKNTFLWIKRNLWNWILK